MLDFPSGKRLPTAGKKKLKEDQDLVAGIVGSPGIELWIVTVNA
jgi:hypothetical protein